MLTADAKRMHLFHRLHHGTTHDLLAAEEQMLLHVDTNAGRSVAMRPNVAARLHALRDAHADLPRPAEAGRSIGIPAPCRGVSSLDLSRMIDAETAAFITRTESFYPPELNAASPAGNRAAHDRMCAAFRASRPAGRDAVADQPLVEHGRTLNMRHYLCGPSCMVLLHLYGGDPCRNGLRNLHAPLRRRPRGRDDPLCQDAEDCAALLDAALRRMGDGSFAEGHGCAA